MFIKVDKNLLTYLGEKKMRLDEMFTLVCFGTNQLDLIKTFLYGRSGDQCTAFMQSMERKGLMRKLSPGVEDFDWDNYEVTEEGNTVYEDCEYAFREAEIYMPEFPAAIIEVEESEADTIAVAFLALWPENTRNTNGDKVKSTLIDVKKKMGQFLRKYRFDKDVILSATERYLSRQRAQGYAYCQQAMYFIMKDGTSKLATECENNNVENTSTWDNVMQ